MSRATNKSEAGFSIVEAMVALAVFAMAGVALVQLQTHSLQTFTDVERRALADTLAQNELVELAAAREAPPLGAREQEIEFAGRSWRLQTNVEQTSDPAAWRAVVVVLDARDGTAAAQAAAFIGAAGGPMR